MLVIGKPLYFICELMPSGNFKLYTNNGTQEPWTQDLPTTEDGLYYLHLGMAYSLYQVTIQIKHPIYYYKNGKINIWFGENNSDEITSLLEPLSLVEDEYYIEKKNGEVLPLSHPDLSTQPSILPQRFGKYPIYETLIPVYGERNYNKGDNLSDEYVIPDIDSDGKGKLCMLKGKILNSKCNIIDASLVGKCVCDSPYICSATDYNKYKGVYLTFEVIEVGEGFITVSNGDTILNITIQYSKDNGLTWNTLALSSTESKITVNNIGDKILFKGLNSGYTHSAYVQGMKFASTTTKVNVYGNIMSLVYGDDFNKEGGDILLEGYTFCYLFYGFTGLVSAENLVLPATTLKDFCYSNMFYGCTSLTSAPVLPATTLAYYCYYCMFYGCTSLTTAPVLPATTLAEGCYTTMFNGCTSLTSVPELPATTLALGCYAGMFQDCTSLTSAPALTATTLAQQC
jgi:hypothetical protein